MSFGNTWTSPRLERATRRAVSPKSTTAAAAAATTGNKREQPVAAASAAHRRPSSGPTSVVAARGVDTLSVPNAQLFSSFTSSGVFPTAVNVRDPLIARNSPMASQLETKRRRLLRRAERANEADGRDQCADVLQRLRQSHLQQHQTASSGVAYYVPGVGRPSSALSEYNHNENYSGVLTMSADDDDNHAAAAAAGGHQQQQLPGLRPMLLLASSSLDGGHSSSSNTASVVPVLRAETPLPRHPIASVSRPGTATGTGLHHRAGGGTSTTTSRPTTANGLHVPAAAVGSRTPVSAALVAGLGHAAEGTAAASAAAAFLAPRPRIRAMQCVILRPNTAPVRHASSAAAAAAAPQQQTAAAASAASATSSPRPAPLRPPPAVAADETDAADAAPMPTAALDDDTSPRTDKASNSGQDGSPPALTTAAHPAAEPAAAEKLSPLMQETIALMQRSGFARRPPPSSSSAAFVVVAARDGEIGSFNEEEEFHAPIQVARYEEGDEDVDMGDDAETLPPTSTTNKQTAGRQSFTRTRSPSPAAADGMVPQQDATGSASVPSLRVPSATSASRRNFLLAASAAATPAPSHREENPQSQAARFELNAMLRRSPLSRPASAPPHVINAPDAASLLLQASAATAGNGRSAAAASLQGGAVGNSANSNSMAQHFNTSNFSTGSTKSNAVGGDRARALVFRRATSPFGGPLFSSTTAAEQQKYGSVAVAAVGDDESSRPLRHFVR